MSLMNGKNAAIIANGAYGVQPATNNQQASTLAKQETRFTQNSMSGPSLSVGVTAMAGFAGQAGVVLKEQAGFGVLLERHGGLEREYILAMRGTVSKLDWLSNLNVGMTRGPTGSVVHSGFASIYNSMQADVMHMLKGLGAAKVHFIGHSLGGSLASLAALHYASSGGTGSSYLYTFGAPRIGGPGFSSDMRRYLGQGHIKRVYALSDPVPMIPLFPFFHCPIGASGINANYSSITSAAHSMADCYVPNMPGSGWPVQVAEPNKADPDYWLRQAEGASGIGSKMGYYFLGKALTAIMPTLHMLCGGASSTMTLLDMLSEAISKGIAASKKIADYMLRFVQAALRFVRGVGRAGMTAADLTVSFLRYVLGMMMTQVKNAAQSALMKIV